MVKILVRFSVLSLLLFSACKSSYEKIRTSAEPQLILKAADKYYASKEYFKAQTLYELVLTSFRGQKEAEEIYFNYAYTHYYLSEYELASHLFKTFANTFINSSKKEDADFLSVYSLYKTSPVYRLDQSGTEKAIEGFQLFVNSYPNSSKIIECNKLIDECRSKLEFKAFEAGKLYYDMRNYQACLTSLQNLLNDFPETKNAREIRYLMCKSAYQLAERSIFEKQKERFIDAKQYAEDFIRRYVSGKYLNEVKDLNKKAITKLKSPEYDRYQNTSARN
ncbi:MAG: outer membrane protein assembly factor BamD [Saprospiraceae bacterium]|nr:outer membrane protein assembly factor BamD [Saprospiraceae bacterium]MBK8450156.1 outer membrane protein assembly factor BamD [Saprospiraceae bacterium]MBK8483749.1 outer membrane protein assembly factor BamD [Saprospiraceae bacterium]MBK9721865.1 outer membrane protein assembly factor BamD [Saprospiraceae bacterium]